MPQPYPPKPKSRNRSKRDAETEDTDAELPDEPEGARLRVELSSQTDAGFDPATMQDHLARAYKRIDALTQALSTATQAHGAEQEALRAQNHKLRVEAETAKHNYEKWRAELLAQHESEAMASAAASRVSTAKSPTYILASIAHVLMRVLWCGVALWLLIRQPADAIQIGMMALGLLLLVSAYRESAERAKRREDV